MNKIMTAAVAVLFISMPLMAQNNKPSLKQGDDAPAFSAPDTLGVSHSLSDYEGKYVVLDFWASWCGDCRREIPELKKIYEDFKEATIGPEQVEVDFLSISFDNKEDAWKSMLRKEQFGWPQVSNLQAWKENPIAKAYDLHWIPTFIIVNPMGKVVAAVVTANELRTELDCLK